ncbi:MAG: class I SAM-dependent methyltransferase [Beijerinckiaceae bacterium]|nr:class I SAM-dependent methyltransferase [Beijerinckiaceae bacterium]MDO9439549.1 class I SAM-dependent methyltransferase [Beijerinckiaceae bacterium]
MSLETRQPGSLSHADVENAYARWAPFYDLVFTATMRPGRKAGAAAINRLSGRILDVGVGTGLELPMFSRELRITGIDLSDPMLEVARKRVASLGLDNVEDLRVMDAMQLTFPDASFDGIVAPYVLTVVPDPHKTLDEMLRVVKPGGEIVLVNHIGAESGPVAAVEAWLGRRAASLGWRPEFPWSIVQTWLDAHPDAALVERRTLAPLGLFTLVRIKRAPDA